MTWIVRRVLWFAVAYTIVIVVHEAAHALVARALGLEAILFHFWVNVDAANQATIGQRAAFGVAGPLSSLLLGLVVWRAYRGATDTPTALPLLYVAAHGVSNFSGNLMSAAFVGDFSNVATWIGLPMIVRYIVSAAGALVTAAVLFRAGRELARLAPPGAGSAAAIAGVLFPALVGTGLIILVNQPIPLPGFAGARLAESTFWIFAAAGSFTAGAVSNGTDEMLRLRRLDVAVAVMVLAIVRVMTRGITL